jgi:hypothetical protein
LIVVEVKFLPSQDGWALYFRTFILDSQERVYPKLAVICLLQFGGEIDRLWPEGVPQMRNDHGSAYVTGYAHDEAGNLVPDLWGLVYLGMVGRKIPSGLITAHYLSVRSCLLPTR